jgi:hypothetical protein
MSGENVKINWTITGAGDVADEQHPTEQKYPEQCRSYREILEKLYKLMLDKNYDYLPQSISFTGEIGILVRLVDKLIRLLNLYGWDFENKEFKAKKEPKNEAIEDTLIDIANYSIIWLVLREGNWGR